MIEDIKPSMLAITLKNKKKDYFIALTKSANIVKKLGNKSFHPLINNKIAIEIWIILQDKFYNILPTSVSQIFLNICSVKLLDCKHVADYTNRYQIAYDKLFNVINKKF